MQRRTADPCWPKGLPAAGRAATPSQQQFPGGPSHLQEPQTKAARRQREPLLSVKHTRWPGSARGPEATVRLPGTRLSLQGGVQSVREHARPPATPGRQGQEDSQVRGQTQGGPVAGLRFSPRCLKLRSGFWAFAFCGRRSQVSTGRRTSNAQTETD